MTPRQVIAFIKARYVDTPFYVYALLKPDGAPFYVGVGTGRRLLDHAIFARRPDLDSHKLRVIRKIWRRGEEVTYEIRGWFANRSSAELFEAELIAKLGRRDLRTGPLSNVTAGGEGAPSPSGAARNSRSRSLKLAWRDRDKSRAMAHLHNPEVWARAAAARKGKKYPPRKVRWHLSAEECAARSARLKANPISRRPDVAAKISASLTGRVVRNHHMKRAENRARISGANNPASSPLIIEGKSFATRKEACAEFGVCMATIDYWLKRGLHGAHRLSLAAKN